MTRSRCLASLLFIAVGLCAPGEATAQYGAPVPDLNPGGTVLAPYLGYGPNVNPYLRLTDPFSSQIPLYQSQVRPLIDNRAALERQGAQIQSLSRPGRGVGYAGGAGTRRALGNAAGPILSTGHSTRYMNYSHYYYNHIGRR